MNLSDDFFREISQIIREPRKVQVSTATSLPLTVPPGNDLVEINATVLCADISDSKVLVEEQKPALAATAYKAFLRGVSIIVRAEGGQVLASEGDRVIAAFIGPKKEAAAVNAALKLHYAVKKTINVLLPAQFPTARYVLHHATGIDSGVIRAQRTGLRPTDDVLWIGPAINRAAKIATLPDDYATRVTQPVFETLNDTLTLSGGKAMWEYVAVKEMGEKLYRSNWLLPL